MRSAASSPRRSASSRSNAVLVSAVAWIAVFAAAPMQASGATLAQAIVLAGIAQLVVTGVGFLRVRGTRMRPHFGFSAETRRFFALAAPSLIAAGIPQLKLIAGAMVGLVLAGRGVVALLRQPALRIAAGRRVDRRRLRC
jgi:peptidoglycan biosynthesis protein MviN/MurJ (putative lipid II flippase)